MERSQFQPVYDAVEDYIHELEQLTAAWRKNVEQGRSSPILRRAIIQAAGELANLPEFTEKGFKPKE